MEENVLKSFETFDEFPNKYLKVNSNSNYYFIRKKDNNFVTKKNIDLISNITKEQVLVKSSYYDVISGNLIYKEAFISDINGKSKEIIKCEDVKIILLSTIFNVKGNGMYYLTKDDINVLVSYEEKSKTYVK